MWVGVELPLRTRREMLAEIYEKHFGSLVFFIFSEGLQSSCVYTARAAREMIVEEKKKEEKKIIK